MTVVSTTINSRVGSTRCVERSGFTARLARLSLDNRSVYCLLAILAALSVTPAWAGEISFEPTSAIVPAGGTVEFVVSIASTDLPSFDSIDLLFSSDLEGLELSFTYDPGFETTLPAPVPVEVLVFPTDLFVGGTQVDGWQAPLVIGTLRVTASQLSVGVHPDAVQVRPDGEAEVLGSAVSVVGFAETRTTETLNGRLSLTVSNQDSGNDTGADPPPGDVDPMPTDDPGMPVDSDNDGTVDELDTDDDGDGVADTVDAFPLDASETVDTDGDGVGDNSDAFPADPTETVDTDGDGVGDVGDEDDDNDGVIDAEDAFPLDPEERADRDGDGIGDNADAGGENANTGPTATGGVCGFGMIGPSLLLVMGLVGQRIRRKTVNTQPH